MAHHGQSLAEDLDKLLAQAASRRRTLRWLLTGAALPLVGCGGGTDSVAGTSSGSAADAPVASSGTCSVIPEETGGPYPADGTNSNGNGIANALALSGIVRSDIRSSFAGATAMAAGVPLTIKLELVNVNANCASAAGAAVYLWHCDKDGNYSMYSSGLTGQNYLRGLQEADSSGVVTFKTIFPGCYSGRMPHVHFEVFRSLAVATSASSRIKTSQFAFPVATANAVYATSGYSASVRNLASISFASDMVFSDGIGLQLASMTGDAATGYVATLRVGVSL